MDTAALKKFAPAARTLLREQVSARLNQVLAEGSAARREAPNGVRELEGEISRTSRDQVVERVAYTWFNRFTALRFMDANGYTGTRVVSPADGQTRPEVLAEAAAGVIGEEVPEDVAAQVRALLDNRIPSRDPQGEAYRLLLVSVCNHWHGVMPFMFEKIADCTELLMPEDMLSANSLLARLRAVMTEDTCQDVEIIGWLYQFYISEKKDEVFAGLKKNVKITAESIPAATQLFTPHWIVRYLVENTLGRLWLLNRPHSKLAEWMDYYIAPEQPETDFQRIPRPDEIRICDPACGSGHMLTYAFDLLYAIYEEEGYEASEIPGLILTKNLYGIEIDDRAGALVAFALAMKAAAKLGRRRFLRMQVQPNICVLENVRFDDKELRSYITEVGRDLFSNNLHDTLGQFNEAKNFGSLIVPMLANVGEAAREIASKRISGNLFLHEVHERVQSVLRMAEFLTPKYHVVVTNPPYMGSKGMNKTLSSWISKKYPDSKSDLMTCFMDRAQELCLRHGFWGMINIPSWLFLSSLEVMRENLIKRNTISSLVHLGRGIFGSDFGTVAFIIHNKTVDATFKATYRRLFDRHVNVRSPEVIMSLYNDKEYGKYYASAQDFRKIPGSPIAYWVSDIFRESFDQHGDLAAGVTFRQGMSTTDSSKFERRWHEISKDRINFGRTDPILECDTKSYWYPFNKGGDFRKWYGNQINIVKYEKNGEVLLDLVRAKYPNISDPEFVIKNRSYFFKEFISYSSFTSAAFSAKYVPPGFAFSVAGSAIFVERWSKDVILGFLCSKAMSAFASAINPTFGFQISDIARVPFSDSVARVAELDSTRIVRGCIGLSKSDWDAYETSWDFLTLPLLEVACRGASLAETWAHLRRGWRRKVEQAQEFEEENNRIFIRAYGLQDELTPEVPLAEITLTCNPAYRYRGKKTEAELEEILLTDTTQEFISYAVGCLFGRYSLDEPGLILADQGDGMAQYLAKVPIPSFVPDADNVLPMLEGGWFPNDISERFRQFLRVTFGDEHFEENLAFIEKALGKDIRKYFTRDFFNDHVKRYKNRPIYWLFSSPKGTFNALIYMHRYRPDTVSIVLNDYLRELRNKLEAYRRGQEALSISGDASQGQRTKALKEVDAVGKQIAELDTYERDVLFPLASRRIEIDLDDGVKVNYPKFGDALKPIKGLAEADD